MFLILLASIFSFFGQVFSSRAFQLEKAARIAAISYIQLVTGFLWDIFYFEATLEWHHIVGSILIIGMIIVFGLLKAFGVIKA